MKGVPWHLELERLPPGREFEVLLELLVRKLARFPTSIFPPQRVSGLAQAPLSIFLCFFAARALPSDALTSLPAAALARVFRFSSSVATYPNHPGISHRQRITSFDKRQGIFPLFGEYDITHSFCCSLLLVIFSIPLLLFPLLLVVVERHSK